MERKESPQQQFETASAHYYEVLKNGFIADVEKATDKQYAYNHFKREYFEHNPFIPHYSVFFQELKKPFDHFIKIDEENVIEQTYLYVHLVKETSAEAYHLLREILSNAKPDQLPSYIELSKLPTIYLDALQDESRGNTLDVLLELEKKVLDSDDESILALLAMYHATQRLLKDVDDFFPYDTPTKSIQHTHQFTRSQQVLIAYYLFILAGARPRVSIDLSSCAEILHAISGIPYTKIDNSELYKKFKNPLGNSSPKRTIEDLNTIRPYLAKLDNESILQEIDLDIRGLQSE
jgi:hypothetical protein